MLIVEILQFKRSTSTRLVEYKIDLIVYKMYTNAMTRGQQSSNLL